MSEEQPIGVVGLGYVGLPLAVAFCEAGREVIGVDTDQGRCASVARGESHIGDVSGERLTAVRDRLHTTTRYAQLSAAEAVIIAVPTPPPENREPDLRPLMAAPRSMRDRPPRGHPPVLEATTHPGPTPRRP